MSTVDSRIVTMKFDNSQFERGASTTISTLDRLKQALGLNGATKGLEQVQDAANRTNLSGLEGGITKINAGFAAMATIAVTALATITQKAMSVGAQLIKSLTLDPVMDGFREYELKMGSIQTILANTQKDGTTLKQVDAALEELNRYADKTIYNFGEMTKAVGLFTNAGIGIEDATAMIKGFSNAAAASGATAEGTARAQYQLSQALTTGTIRLMDWKSLTNAGMGNKNMQNSLIAIADAMGTFEGKSITAKEAGDNFNGSLEKEWLSADVMEQYLKIMAGEVTPAQMKAIGLSAEQIKSLQKEAKTAEEAAVKVRTFSKLLGTIKESIGSSWSATFGIIIGDFDEATKLFTDINSGIGEVINKSAEARNKVLQDWKDRGGRDTLIDALATAVKGLGTIIKPITKAFREIFPAKTGKELYDLTVQFKEFAAKIKIGSDTAEKLKETFKGFFSIFSIIKQVIGGVIGVLGDLIGTIGKSSGGFLTITANIGKFITGIDEALKNGDKLSNFFETLSTILQTPVKLIQELTTYVVAFFSGFDISAGDAVNSAFDRMAQRLGPLAILYQALENAVGAVSEKFRLAMEILAPYVQQVQDAFKAVGTAVKEAFSGADINNLFDLINTGLFAALVLAVRKFLRDFKIDFGGGFIETIKETFGTLTGTLQAVQQNLRANVLVKIAGAIGAMAAAMIALSLVDSKKLTLATVAMAGAMTQLMIAMAIMTKIGGMTGFVKVPVLAGSMILISAAVIMLAQAIKTLSRLDWEALAKGIIGVSASMGVLVIALTPLAKASGGMIATGLGLIALAFAMRVIASAVEKFSTMDAGDIAKGLIAVTAAIVLLGISLKTMPPSLPIIALGLLGLGAGLLLLSTAIAKMGEIHFGKILLGAGMLAAAIVGIGMALGAMPPNLLPMAFALGVVSLALIGIGQAIKMMGNLSGDQIAKGLIVLSAAFVILAFGLNALNGAIMGAAAILAVAVALNFLVPALKALGNLTMKEIVVSLIALAGALTVLGIAAYVINGVSVVMLALAGSLALLGAAVALTGLGFLWFAKAIQILVDLGTAAAGAMGLMLTTIVQAIPQVMNAFAEGIVRFTKTITENIPLFVTATIKLLNAILDTINELAPKIAKTMSNILNLMLDYLMVNSPKIVQAGFQLMMDFMNKLRDNIYQIVDVSAEIMRLFIKGIGDKAEPLADEGAKTVVKLIDAMANAIRNNSKGVQDASRNLASAVIAGFISGIAGGMNGIIQAILGMASGAINAAKKAFGIASPSKEFMEMGMFVDQGLANGIDKYSYVANNSAEQMGTSLMDTFKSSIENIDAFVSKDMNLSPVITPVLDLTDIEKAKLDEELTKKRKMLSIPGLFVESSTNYADSIASDYQNYFANGQMPTDGTNTPTTVMFEQNNYSPKALSEVELYRQTKNQLALAKGVLTS